ncbi:efflux RND transporter periplasmic adaptor subunit [Candidatus Poribacteria bacterium]|nr:efflux RND transporter periplasmic adaptor subunit [Candidatus Poribacteria bacterium]
MKNETDNTGDSRGATRPPILKLLGLVVAGALAIFLWLRFGPPSHRSEMNGRISATGTIEATEVDISSEVGGQIEKLLVDEGDLVKKDQLVAQLDDSQLGAEVTRAEAAQATARATLQDLMAGARANELERGRARVNLARATLALAESDWKRASELFDEGVFSGNQRDNARANLDVARSQYNVALEELKLLEAGARPDQIEAARWQVKQAEASLELARVRLEKTLIYAPMAGTVLVKDSEAGEVVSPGVPIVTIADVDDMWVKIYIDEVNIGRVKLGQPAKVQVDAFPGKEFSGKVTLVSSEAEFTPKNIQTREDRVKLVFAVKIGVGNAGGLLKPGMYADIKLEAQSPGRE